VAALVTYFVFNFFAALKAVFERIELIELIKLIKLIELIEPERLPRHGCLYFEYLDRIGSLDFIESVDFLVPTPRSAGGVRLFDSSTGSLQAKLKAGECWSFCWSLLCFVFTTEASGFAVKSGGTESFIYKSVHGLTAGMDVVLYCCGF